jgi:hypothetical protein
MRDTPTIGRPPARPLELHPTFISRLREKSIQTGLSDLRLVQICGECSESGAIKILQGKAKQTPATLRAVNAVAAFVGAPLAEIVVGVVMPIVPTQVLVAVLDDVIVAVTSEFAKNWLTYWRHSFDLDMRRGQMVEVEE